MRKKSQRGWACVRAADDTALVLRREQTNKAPRDRLACDSLLQIQVDATYFYSAHPVSPLKQCLPYSVELSFGPFSRHRPPVLPICQQRHLPICQSGPPTIPSKPVQARVAFPSVLAGGWAPRLLLHDTVDTQCRQSTAMMMCSCATSGRASHQYLLAEQMQNKIRPAAELTYLRPHTCTRWEEEGGASIQQRPPVPSLARPQIQHTPPKASFVPDHGPQRNTIKHTKYAQSSRFSSRMLSSFLYRRSFACAGGGIVDATELAAIGPSEAARLLIGTQNTVNAPGYFSTSRSPNSRSRGWSSVSVQKNLLIIVTTYHTNPFFFAQRAARVSCSPPHSSLYQ